VTHPSKSKTRSVAAIGNGRVIPAKAGIHFSSATKLEPTAIVQASKSKTRGVASVGNGCVILLILATAQ
jgi:hypothetical protein